MNDEKMEEIDVSVGDENDLTLMVESGREEEEGSGSTQESVQEQDESTSDSDEMFFILSEDHFSDDMTSRDSELLSLSNLDFDLPVDVSSTEREIRKYIKLIRYQESSDDQKKKYISKLCQLRLRLSQMTESSFEKYLNGHKFSCPPSSNDSSVPSPGPSSTLACDVCLGKQTLFISSVNSIIAKYSSFVANNFNFISTCSYCDFSIHKKCLISILGHRHNHENFMTNTVRVRKCPSVLFQEEEEEEQVSFKESSNSGKSKSENSEKSNSENSEKSNSEESRMKPKIETHSKYIILSICPEIGLLKQGFRCNDCGCTILNMEESRLDDYDGRYYCHSCHWNDVHATPGRMIHNWDSGKYPVSRKSLQILHFIKCIKLFDLMSLNSMLFGLIPELASVKRTRVEIGQMTSYIRCCLYQPNKPNLSAYKPHLLDESKLNFYSLHDLIHFNHLQLSLIQLKSILVAHITLQCQGCRGKGFFCTLCRDKSDLLFPFSPNISNCPDCSTVYHRTCFHRKHKICLKCTNRKTDSRSTEVSQQSEHILSIEEGIVHNIENRIESNEEERIEPNEEEKIEPNEERSEPNDEERNESDG